MLVNQIGTSATLKPRQLIWKMGAPLGYKTTGRQIMLQLRLIVVFGTCEMNLQRAEHKIAEKAS